MRTFHWMEYLPGELLDKIASADPAVYWGLALAYPRFARSLTAGRRLDYAVSFGHDYHVHRKILIRPVGHTCVWTRNGVIHRADGPAVVDDINLVWYVNGIKTKSSGGICNQRYYDKDGSLHSDTGPASIGTLEQAWFMHGLRHRDDGPAVIKSNGMQIWYQYNQVHRDDGPACIKSGEYSMWFKYDKKTSY